MAVVNSNLKSLAAAFNSNVSSQATITNNSILNYVTNVDTRVGTLEQLFSSGFASSLNDGIYTAMVGLGPSGNQVNIEYHWTKILNTVTLQGHIIIPGSVETTNGVSNGLIKFKLPVAIQGTFANPGNVTYTYNPGTSTSMTRYNPRLIGQVFLDSKTAQAAIDSFEVYGEPGTNNVAANLVNNNTTYSNVCFHFRIVYLITPISYSTSITNQTTNTVYTVI